MTSDMWLSMRLCGEHMSMSAIRISWLAWCIGLQIACTTTCGEQFSLDTERSGYCMSSLRWRGGRGGVGRSAMLMSPVLSQVAEQVHCYGPNSNYHNTFAGVSVVPLAVVCRHRPRFCRLCIAQCLNAVSCDTSYSRLGETYVRDVTL